MKLLPGEILVLRTCGPNGESSYGFRWPLEVGAVVTAPDWEPTFKCGNGLHGLPWGVGDPDYLSLNNDAKWLLVAVEISDSNYRGGQGNLTDKCKFHTGRVEFVGNRVDTISELQKYMPVNTPAVFLQQLAADQAIQMAGDKSTQMAGYQSTQTAGDKSTQMAGGESAQTAGQEATQKAGYKSTQTAMDWGSQMAGDRSTQTARYSATQASGNESIQRAWGFSVQSAGYDSTQMAGDWSTQTAGCKSTQTAGSWSNQTVGNYSWQRAGLGTVQIVRWDDDKVATRIITSIEADKWFYVENGVWRLATPEEITKLPK